MKQLFINSLLFLLIQLVSTVLTILGWVILLPASFFRFWVFIPAKSQYHWRLRHLLWLWDNLEDGVLPAWYLPSRGQGLRAYLWTAWRNPVGNLRFVPGVSDKNRGLFRRYFGSYYFQAGFRPDHGWPVLSFGKTPVGGFDY